MSTLLQKKAHKDFHVYSGLHTTNLKAGQTYKHHGYMSSSIDPDQTTAFGHIDNNGVQHVMKLKIKKDSNHGAYVHHHADVKKEKEFLIGRGKKIKITHQEDIKNKRTGRISHRIHHAEIVD